MSLRLPLIIALTALLLAGCGDDKSNPSDTSDSSDTTGDTVADTTGDTLGDTPGDTPGDTAGDTPGDTPSDTSGDTPGDLPNDMPGDTPSDMMSQCFELPRSAEDFPLAIDGAFAANSETWRRPHDEPAVCPATALLPDTAAAVPFVAYSFCNTDSVAHTFDIEFLAQEGPNLEPPLDDPYLIVYDTEGIPMDPLQCAAVNDDIPDAIDSSDSILEGFVVPPGGAITVVGTTFTFDPNDGTGTGGYIMVVSSVD